MTTLCSVIADRAAEKLNDEDWVTYTEPKFIGALNAACRVISGLRADACMRTEVVGLVAGTRQSVPPKGMQFIGANRNFVDAVTPGRAVQMKVVVDKNRVAPNWHSEPEEDEVIEVMPDLNDPLIYWNYPPVPAGVLLEIVYTRTPDEVLSLDDTLPLHDKFEQAVLHWVLFEMYSRDSSSPNHMARAAESRETAMQLLGMTGSAQSSAAPEVKH